MSRLSIPENIPLDTFFGEVFRVSGNLELNASFNFEGNTAGDFPFTMESNGSIRISAFLDYERKSSYVVHIKGQEGERAVLRQFTISIEDIFEMDLNEAYRYFCSAEKIEGTRKSGFRRRNWNFFSS